MRMPVVVLVALLALGPAFAQPAPPEPPAVPPEKAARAVAPIALVNAGFESTLPGQLGAPEGWWAVQHAGPKSYTFTLDTTNPRAGLRSLRIENIGPEPFGTVYQKVGAAPFRGRSVRLAAWVRTDGAKGNRYGTGAGLNLHAMSGGYPIAYVMMRKNAVHGTTDWTRYEVALKVPDEADQIEAGLNLFGPGIAWLDDVTLDVMDGPLAGESTRTGVAPAGR